jgi:ketosteroid isomerase-like protein
MQLGPTLEERVRRLEDRTAINELIARYCLVMDNRDVAGMEALFTLDVHFWSADGVMDAHGRDAAIEMFKGRFTVLGPSNHFTHDRIIEFDPLDHDKATGIVLSHAEMQRKGQPMLAAMRYHDVYQRCDGRWRISSSRSRPASRSSRARSRPSTARAREPRARCSRPSRPA